MKLVLDASVAIAAVRSQEPHHARSRALVDRVLRGEDDIVVPALFCIEVVAGLVRRGHDDDAAERFAGELVAAPAETVTIGARRATSIARYAGRARLRAADACYAWIASRRNLALVTLDDEIIRRGLGIVVRLP